MLTRKDIEMRIPQSGQRFDVIVCGGGPAGLGAALGAAVNGAKTLLIERKGFFGGIASTSLWMPMNRLFIDGKPRGGVHDLFIEEIKKLGTDAYSKGKENWFDGDGLHIHPDYLRLASFNALERAGVYYRLHSQVTGVIMEDGNTVTGITVSGKRGDERFFAPCIIDCTGDGDVAFRAGCEMSSGGKGGKYMPVSLGFALAEVDTERLNAYLEEHDFLEEVVAPAREKGYLTSVFYAFDPTQIEGVVSVNNGGWIDAGPIDASDPVQATLAERIDVAVCMDFVSFVHEFKVPGLENCKLLRIGAEIGARETRRIVGEYVFDIADAMEGKEFDDVICRKYGAVDSVIPEYHAKRFEMKMVSGTAFPYRSLLPQKIDGLLAAGKCASCTQLGQAAGKSMGNMMAMGQAAGVASALCAKSGRLPRNADISEVQKTLRSMGVNL